MNQAGYLVRLQRVDTKLDQIKTRLAQIDQLLSEDARLVNAKRSAEEAKQAMELARQNLRSMEHFVSEQQIKIEQSNATLYSGLVKNPKELQDLQMELASLRKHLATLEDRQLEAMLALEEAEKEASHSHSNLTLIEAKVIQEKAGLVGERNTLITKQENLEIEREAFLPPITPANLSTYQRIRSQKNGIAVTETEDSACARCGAPVRPAEAQAARIQSQLFFCNSCGRILFAG